MATIRTCDRCRGREDAWTTEVECAYDHGGSLYKHTLWFGDLCGPCRQSLMEWLKPLHEGPRKRKEEA